jgi:Cu-processing system permease protein
MARRIAAIAGAVFSDALRRRVIYAIGLFALALAFGVPSLPNYGLGVAAALYREVVLALTFAGAFVLTLVLASNRIPSEVEHRTVYNVLARPVSRWEYVVGTWLGTFAVVGASIVAFTVVEQGVGLIRYGDPMWRIWEGAFAIWLEMGVIAAFATAVSALTGPVVVSVASIAFVFVAHARSGLFGAEGSGLAYALYPSLDTFNIINPVAHGSGVGVAYGAGMLLAFAGWAGALLLLGALGFGRRDL